MSLADAEAALDAGDRLRALDLLLDAWRAARAPAIADAVDVVSADVARSLPPLEPGKTVRQMYQNWTACCRQARAADVPRLLDGLAPGNASAPEVQDQLERLERHHGPDPRVAGKLMALLCGGFRWNPKPMWGVVFRQLSSLRDVRGLSLLQDYLAGDRGARRDREHLQQGDSRRIPVFYADFFARMERLGTLLSAPPPALSDEDRARLARLVARAHEIAAGPPLPRAAVEAHAPVASPPPRGEAELLALVYAAPDDPAPRQVYGDLMSEHGSPRGELIALQHKPSPTKKEQTRVRALLKAHLPEWLGPLEPVVIAKTARFEGGFLAACTTRFRNKAQRAELGAHPAWATLREVATDEEQVVRAAPWLRTLTGVPGALLRKLCAGPPLPIASLGVVLDTRSLSDCGPELAEATAFPRVTELACVEETYTVPLSAAGYAWLRRGWIAERVRLLTLTKRPSIFHEHARLGEWMALLPRTLTARLELSTFVATLIPSPRGHRLELTLHFVPPQAPIFESLADVDPARVEHVQITLRTPVMDDVRRRLDGLLARFGSLAFT